LDAHTKLASLRKLNTGKTHHDDKTLINNPLQKNKHSKTQHKLLPVLTRTSVSTSYKNKNEWK